MSVDQVIQILVCICGFLITFMVGIAAKHLGQMQKSIAELNIKMERVVLTVDVHETRLDRLETM